MEIFLYIALRSAFLISEPKSSRIESQNWSNLRLSVSKITLNVHVDITPVPDRGFVQGRSQELEMGGAKALVGGEGSKAPRKL